MHFDIKSIEILKELLHPINNDNVIGPPLIQLDEQLRPMLHFQLVDDIRGEVILDGLRVLSIEDTLRMLVLEGTQIEYDPVIHRKKSI